MPIIFHLLKKKSIESHSWKEKKSTNCFPSASNTSNRSKEVSSKLRWLQLINVNGLIHQYVSCVHPTIVLTYPLSQNAQSYERPRTQHATDKTQLHERCFDRTLTSVIAATAVVVHTSATNEQTGPACGIHEYMTHFTR